MVLQRAGGDVLAQTEERLMVLQRAEDSTQPLHGSAMFSRPYSILLLKGWNPSCSENPAYYRHTHNKNGQLNS
jgi:hypothetical protein